MNGVVYASYSLRMEGQLELSSVALPMCLFHRSSSECRLRVRCIDSSESTEFTVDECVEDGEW